MEPDYLPIPKIFVSAMFVPQEDFIPRLDFTPYEDCTPFHDGSLGGPEGSLTLGSGSRGFCAPGMGSGAMPLKQN